MNNRLFSLALACLTTAGTVASAQVIAPSTFTTMIQVQGEEVGAEFDDWTAAGIPITVTDPLDNAGGTPLPFVDINTVQVANDQDNLYIRITTHSETISALGSGMFLAFDTDQDASTGYDVFDLGLIGSETGYQTDYPFQQDIGVFNTLVDGVVDFGGDFIGLAVTYPFFETGPPVGTQMEWSIPLNLAVGPDAPGTPVFASDSFDFMVWSDQGAGDVTDVISYTLASGPVVEGDYNGDGVVDAIDYTVWRDSDGDIGVDLPADGNGDGEVNGTDYTIWAGNYAGTASALAAGVPEPTAALLLGLGLVGFGAVRRSA